MKVIKVFLILFVLTIGNISLAQNNTNFTQFFVNPYMLNPSFAGADGQKVLSLAYRKQWLGFSESPSAINASFHSPAKAGLNFGFLLNNETRGLLSHTGFMGSVAYELDFGDHRYVRFGLSTGAAMNKIDLAKFDDDLVTDPALANALDNNFTLLGNAGVSFHLKNTHLGFVLPSLFAPTFISTKSFTVEEVKPLQALIIHASNRFYFSNYKHLFEPYLVYRINSGLPSQLEAAAVVHLNHAIWFGTSYKQDFGISALGGFKLNKLLAIGTSFSFNNMSVSDVYSPSFELQMSYLLGPKIKNLEVYSFVSTTKPKTIRKTASQLAAEKRKREELARKNKEEALEKKKTQMALVQKQTDEKETKQQEQIPKKDADSKDALNNEQSEEAYALKLAEEKRQQELASQAAEVEKEKRQAELTIKAEPVKQPTPISIKQELIKSDSLSKQQIGDPRLRQEAVTNVVTPPPHEDEHGESERITRLDLHDDNPTEHHGEALDAHPHAERHEFVQKGGHQDELDYGDYIVVGVFKSDINAKHFSEGLANLKFSADYGHLTVKNLWYVYLLKTESIDVARAERDKYRRMKMFRDAWLLTVHD